MRIPIRYLKAVTIAVVMFSLVGCGSNPDPNVSPQTYVSRYAGDFISSASVVQKYIADTPQIPEAQKAQAMATFIKVSEAGTKLSQLLATYDAATNLAQKESIAKDVNSVLAIISTLLLEVNIPIGDMNIRQEIARLVQNTSKVLLTIQSLVPQLKMA